MSVDTTGGLPTSILSTQEIGVPDMQSWTRHVYGPADNGLFSTFPPSETTEPILMKLETHHYRQRTTHLSNGIAIRRRGWSRRIASSWLWGLFLCLFFFFLVSSRPQVSAVDRFWHSMRRMTYFRPMMCPLIGYVDIAPHLGDRIPETPILGRE